MIKASLKSLWARKVSLLMSTVAIVLGTAFVAGSFTFTDMLNSAFKGIMNGSVSDVNVAAKGTMDQMGGMSSRQLTPADVARVRQVEGVESAYGSISSMESYPLDKRGKLLTQGAPALGMNYIDAPAFGGQKGLVLKSGRPPHGDGEVVLDPGALEKSGYQLGDKIRIITGGEGGKIEPTIVGTAVYGAKASTGGATYTIFDTPYAQKLFMGGKDAYQSMWITAKPGADPHAVTDRVAKVLPDGFEAKTGEELASSINEMIASQMKFITYFLLFFAAIALLVGAFLIFNTFTILVAQRGRELALFRAMGSSRGQVTTSVIIEAIVLGLVGSAGGLLLGFGLAFGIKALFASMGLDLGAADMRLTMPALIATFGLGLLITLVAALVPAVRAARVPPVAAMSGDVMSGAAGLGWRAALGGVVTAAGAVVLGVGLFKGELDNRLWYIGGGMLLVVLGLAAISPIVGAPVVWALGRLNTAVFGTTGRLAEVNAARNPRRTAVTASALMIGLALVTTVGSAAASMKASMTANIDKIVKADYMVQNPSQLPMPVTIGDNLEKVDGVKSVHRFRGTAASIDGKSVGLGGMKPESFDRMITQTMTSGSAADFTDRTVILSEGYAKDAGRKVGDTVNVVVQGVSTKMPVVGVFATEKGSGLGQVVTTLTTLKDLGAPPADGLISIDLKPGVDKAKVKGDLDRVLEEMPLASVVDQRQFAESQNAGLDQMLMMIYGLLGLAIIIAVLGIMNTLGLSIIERTREIGLLRAVGLNKGQVRRMIVLESVTIALLGAALGIGLGLIFGYAIQQALKDEGLNMLAFPWTQIGVSFAVALLVGALAGLVPAARATKLDVLRAIATE